MPFSTFEIYALSEPIRLANSACVSNAFFLASSIICPAKKAKACSSASIQEEVPSFPKRSSNCALTSNVFIIFSKIAYDNRTSEDLKFIINSLFLKKLSPNNPSIPNPEGKLRDITLKLRLINPIAFILGNSNS